MNRSIAAPTRQIQCWHMQDRKAKVYTQTVSSDGSDNLVSMLYIEWSPKLTLVHEADIIDPANAAKVAKRVNDAGAIDLAHWAKCTPNTKERNNPMYPAFCTFSDDFVDNS